MIEGLGNNQPKKQTVNAVSGKFWDLPDHPKEKFFSENFKESESKVRSLRSSRGDSFLYISKSIWNRITTDQVENKTRQIDKARQFGWLELPKEQKGSKAGYKLTAEKFGTNSYCD